MTIVVLRLGRVPKGGHQRTYSTGAPLHGVVPLDVHGSSFSVFAPRAERLFCVN